MNLLRRRLRTSLFQGGHGDLSRSFSQYGPLRAGSGYDSSMARANQSTSGRSEHNSASIAGVTHKGWSTYHCRQRPIGGRENNGRVRPCPPAGEKGGGTTIG